MKKITFSENARLPLLQGAKVFADAVGSTYGPYGRSVILDRMAGLLITKDGVTVAREVELEGIQGLGAKVLKESCLRTNAESGDGTTSTAVIASELLVEGQKLALAGIDVTNLVSEIRGACGLAVTAIQEMAQPVSTEEELYRVAMVSSNGDEPVSKALAEACMSVGQNGTITIEDGPSLGIDIEYREGVIIDRGAHHPHFLKTDTERVLEHPLIALISGTLRTLEDVQSMLEAATSYTNPLVIVAEDVVGDALQTILANDSQGVINCVVVLAPGFHEKRREWLYDFSAMSEAEVVIPTVGSPLTQWDSNWFGVLKKVVVAQKKTTIYRLPEFEESVSDRITKLKSELEYCGSEYDKDKLKERISNLSESLCVLRVGAATEAEAKERRGRIEDALGSVQSALRNGVIPGAGAAYLAASSALDTDILGHKLLAKALEAPAKRLASNAGSSGDVVSHELSKMLPGMIWDGKKFRHYNEDPAIFDPTEVALSSIRNAVSVATTLLTVECCIS